MHRPDSPFTTVDNYFRDASGATPGTKLQSKFMNMLVRELENIVVASGQVLSDLDDAQVLEAIHVLAGAASVSRSTVINGGFNIAQRATSKQLQNGGGFQLSGYVCDQWLCAADSGVGTGIAVVSRQLHAVGGTPIAGAPKHFMRFIQSSPSSVSAPTIKHPLEGVQGYSDGPFTLRVWMRGASSFDVTVSLTQNFGTGGSPSGAVTSTPVALPVTTTWQAFDLTVTLPSVSGKVLGTAGNDHLLLQFSLPHGVAVTLEMSDCVFVPGDIASRFEPRPFPLEVLLCRRYYEKSYELDTPPATATVLGASHGLTWSANSFGAWPSLETRFAVEKFAAPSMTWYSGNAAHATTPGFVDINGAAVAITGTVGISKRCSGYPTTAATATGGVHGAHFTAESAII